MNTEPIAVRQLSPRTSSVMANMVNMFVSPTLVFEEVIPSAPRTMNFLVPPLLVCLSSLFLLNVSTTPASISATVTTWLDSGQVTQMQAQLISAHWLGVSRIMMCLTVLLGTLWSALLLWLVGKFLLRACFGFIKALEIASLSTTISVLAGIVTGLLVLASNDPAAQPALSLFCPKLSPGTLLHSIMAALNLFHLWVTAVLAIGLARLSRVSFAEAAFWVFGFWIFGRIAIRILA